MAVTARVAGCLADHQDPENDEVENGSVKVAMNHGLPLFLRKPK